MLSLLGRLAGSAARGGGRGGGVYSSLLTPRGSSRLLTRAEHWLRQGVRFVLHSRHGADGEGDGVTAEAGRGEELAHGSPMVHAGINCLRAPALESDLRTEASALAQVCLACG